MDNRKIFKVLEYLWLFTAAFAVIVTIYFLINKNTDEALYFFFVFLIGSVMFLVRRYQRKKQEEITNGNPPKGKPQIKK